MAEGKNYGASVHLIGLIVKVQVLIECSVALGQRTDGLVYAINS